MCEHVRAARGRDNFARCYLGSGVDHLLLCWDCAALFQEGTAVEAGVVCDACFAEAYEWDGVTRAIGAPEVLERPEPLPAAREVAVDGLPAPLADVACAADAGTWFGLCADGTVVAFAGDWSWRTVATGTAVAEEGEKATPRVHVARSGRYVAVANDYGRYGRVVDVATGETVLDLDGGSYYEHTVGFSIAFVTHDGRDVVVHRTDSHRLDATDPATGALLTEREPTDWNGAEPKPEHLLDYDYGRL
jgi:hypothetical protein